MLATRNKGKIAEFRKLFASMDINLLSLDDFPDLGEIEESGANFEENALIKARETALHTGHLAIADDSGLSVDALKGSPGVYSARYAGTNASDDENMEKLLLELKGLSADKRKAAFNCVIAAAKPSGESITVKGSCEGIIAETAVGGGGFGYDPLFFLPEYNCTMAELSSGEKNKISHRANAVKELKNVLPSFIRSLL